MKLAIGVGVQYPPERTLQQRAMDAMRQYGMTLIAPAPNLVGAYTDSAGTTPVTVVGDLFGLLLDRCGTVGSEQVTNGTFDTDTSWNKGTGVTIAGGKVTFTAVANNTGITQPKTLPAGAFCKVSVRCSSYTSGTAYILVNDGSTPLGIFTPVAGKTHTAYFRVGANSNSTLYLSAGATLTAEFDEFSITEITGNHATQSTANFKPSAQKNAQGNWVISCDGSNDSLSMGAVPFQMSDDHCVVAGGSYSGGGGSYMFSAGGVGVFPSIASVGFDAASKPRAVWKDDAATSVGLVHASSVPSTPVVISARKVGDVKQLRVNGVLSQTNSTALGTATITATSIGQFGAGGSPHNGPMTAICFGKGNIPLNVIQLIERWIASLQGQTL